MSPQGDDRPPKRPGGSKGGGKPGGPKQPGAPGSSGKREKGKKPEYTVYGSGGRSGQNRKSAQARKAAAPGLGRGAAYKYHIVSRKDGYSADKADPYGCRHEPAPATASLVWDLDYEWGDKEWMQSRGPRQAMNGPISIYEMHLGSWIRETPPRTAIAGSPTGKSHRNSLTTSRASGFAH